MSPIRGDGVHTSSISQKLCNPSDHETYPEVQHRANRDSLFASGTDTDVRSAQPLDIQAARTLLAAARACGFRGF
jgi:hypothetical protein